MEIENLRVGFVKLELLPRGKGRLLVRAQQLYYAIDPSGTVDMSIDLVNDGDREPQSRLRQARTPPPRQRKAPRPGPAALLRHRPIGHGRHEHRPGERR